MKGNERPLIIHQVNSVYLPRRMDVSPQIRRATLQKLTFTFRTFNTLDPYQLPITCVNVFSRLCQNSTLTDKITDNSLYFICQHIEIEVRKHIERDVVFIGY
jgi:hypothetical protein